MGFLSAIPAGLYAFALRIRHLLYDSRIIKRYRSDIPVVCVGNITVGGTGKTPVTEYLIEKLGRDYTVAVLSQGIRSPDERISGGRDERFVSRCGRRAQTDKTQPSLYGRCRMRKAGGRHRPYPQRTPGGESHPARRRIPAPARGTESEYRPHGLYAADMGRPLAAVGKPARPPVADASGEHRDGDENSAGHHSHRPPHCGQIAQTLPLPERGVHFDGSGYPCRSFRMPRGS